ncbi:MAG: HIT family protein [Deltaproteobacteria bacterium]|nr:MAG: HIT family protein [Deltaproteobacteria bacterium]
MNTTMKKFGYPETLIKDYHHWVVLLRPQQATLGALVLVCKEDVEAFSEVTSEAFFELKEITTAIETHLKGCFTYDKINYLMLMMVDRDVHFHVLPRYSQPQLFSDHEFNDPGWPGPLTLTQYNETGEEIIKELLQTLRETFSRG